MADVGVFTVDNAMRPNDRHYVMLTLSNGGLLPLAWLPRPHYRGLPIVFTVKLDHFMKPFVL